MKCLALSFNPINGYKAISDGIGGELSLAALHRYTHTLAVNFLSFINSE